MSVKFSDFASSTFRNETPIVGYNSLTNTNVKIPKSEFDSLYTDKGYALAGNLNGGTVGAGVTTYIGFGAGTTNTIESTRRSVVAAGVAQKMYIRTVAAMTGTLVATLMKNGTATGVTFTIAAGSAAALYSNSTSGIAVADGDEVSIRIVQSTATSAGIYSFGLIIQ